MKGERNKMGTSREEIEFNTFLAFSKWSFPVEEGQEEVRESSDKWGEEVGMNITGHNPCPHL